MRTTTVSGRMTVVAADHMIDVESAGKGRFSADPRAAFDQWEAFSAWCEQLEPTGWPSAAEGKFGPPSPEPRQVFAIGLNYRDHAVEAGAELPTSPPTFTKFPSAVSGPFSDLVLPSPFVDWEAELVVVIGRRAKGVRAEEAWRFVAGLTIGQDYSERVVQMTGAMPQFSLGKSFPGFAPTGPVLVTPDEFASPDDIGIECFINGESVQSDRTSFMIFSVPELIARLSAVCTLLPGDLIFTGTPGGTGYARDPQRFLVPGDEVVTRIEGIGELRQRCIEGEAYGIETHGSAMLKTGV